MKTNRGMRFFLSLAGGLLWAGGLASPKPLRAQDAAAPATIQYVIEDIQGPDVQVLESGASEWEKAEEGQELDSGDEVKAGNGSEVSLTLESGTSVHLSADTDLKVDQIDANDAGGFLSRLSVVAGNILADVKKKLQESQSSFEVDANGVVCGVRGTAFEVNVQGDDVQTATHEGEVEVSGGGEVHRVKAGNFSSFRAARFQLMRRLDSSEIQRFKKWRTFRAFVFQKRLRRIEAIRTHQRKPWMRRHPRLARKIRRQVRRKIWEKKHEAN